MSENYVFEYAPQPPDPTPPDLPQEPQSSRRTEGEPPRRRSGGWISVAALVCSILALAMSGVALYLSMCEGPEEPDEPPAVSEPEPVTFQYRDMTLEALEGVPVNEYAPGGFYFNEAGRAIYGQGGRQAKTGIDVSFYQKEIDWEAVAGDGIEFAIIRLGYRGYTKGTLQMDERFQDNIRGALDAGLEVGVYFFSQALTPQEAEEEADYVARALGDYAIAYPVTFDWEYITPGNGARTDGMTGEVLTQCARAFCDRVRKHGYEPAVYFNQDMGYLTLDLSQLTDVTFWLAEYGGAPDFYYDFDLWQYSNAGTVAGIHGDVDLNLDFRPLDQEG